MIAEQFNMDGLDPKGRKVGLLDRVHLMCFIVDPFNHEWRAKFELGTNMAILVREMIDFFVPADNDGTNVTRARRSRTYHSVQ